MKITAKLVALVLVLLLFGAMSVTLSAEESTVTATAIADNSPIYTIVVPTEISADDLQRTETTSYYDESFTISVPEAMILDGKQISVRVWGDDGEFALKNADGSSTLPYAVFSNANIEDALQNGDVFATFTAAGSQGGFVRIDQKNITKADVYTGNLRFFFAIEDIGE